MNKTIGILIIAAAIAIAYAEETNNAPTNPPAPIKLESASPGAKSHMTGTNGSVTLPKEPAIVLRNVLVRNFNGRIIMIVPERYMYDLTNIYQFQAVPKIFLEEP